MKKYIGIVGLLVILLASCSKDDIMKYDTSKHLLYVPTEDGQDSTVFSFKHHLGVNDYEISMPIKLSGGYLTEDKEYRIEIDKELTTAAEGDYSVKMEQTFHAGVLEDHLKVTLHRTANLSKWVRVALHLVPNETFDIAEAIGDAGWIYVPAGSATVKVIFSDLISRPEWWDQRIVDFFLGEYSDAKYTYFIESSGRSDLEGCSTNDIIEIVRKFREDIRKNGWTEDNGAPIEIPMKL